MPPTSPYYFKIPRLYVGIIKLVNTALIALTGYSFGRGDTAFAASIGVIYSVSKTFLEITETK